MDSKSRLTKRDCKFLSTLITECWKVCKKDGKRNLAPFMEKCNHLRKYLKAMCNTVNESRSSSFLTKFDFGKIMNLVMDYAWNCWDIGQLHYDWKEAELDGHRKLVEDYLRGLCVEPMAEGFMDSLRRIGGNIKDAMSDDFDSNEIVQITDKDGKKWSGKVVDFDDDLRGWAIAIQGQANESPIFAAAAAAAAASATKKPVKQYKDEEDLKKQPKGEIPDTMKKVGDELTVQRKSSSTFKMKVVNVKNLGDGKGQIIAKVEKRLGR